MAERAVGTNGVLDRIAIDKSGANLAGLQRLNVIPKFTGTGRIIAVQEQYGNYSVLKDDDILVRDAGSDVRTETLIDGSTRTFVTREDGGAFALKFRRLQRAM